MTLPAPSLEGYLNRLELTDAPRPDHAGLVRLHRRHLLTVPFENLDIHLGFPIVLEVERLLAKIIDRNRGGFCYELNGSFAALLSGLGFETTLHEARVHGAAGLGIRYDHACVMVQLDRPYLVDVGFGDSFVEPMLFEPSRIHKERGRRFVIEQVGGGWFDLLQDDEPQYRFSTEVRTLGDFTPGCEHHQTSPESSFTQKTVCSLATEDGRITISGDRLIESTGDERREHELTGAALASTLRHRFGIELSGEEAEKLAAGG